MEPPSPLGKYLAYLPILVWPLCLALLPILFCLITFVLEKLLVFLEITCLLGESLCPLGDIVLASHLLEVLWLPVVALLLC